MQYIMQITKPTIINRTKTAMYSHGIGLEFSFFIESEEFPLRVSRFASFLSTKNNFFQFFYYYSNILTE